MDRDEYLSRLQAAYFHLQALGHAQERGEAPQEAAQELAWITDVLAVVYLRAADALSTPPWEIPTWDGPANRDWEGPRYQKR